MSPDGAEDEQLLRVQVDDRRMTAAASAAAVAAADSVGFDAEDAERVGSLVRRLGDLVCSTDFDGDADVRFDLTLRESRDGLALGLDDRGLPFSLAGDRGSMLGSALLSDGLADHVQVRSDGTGNRIVAEIRPDRRTFAHLVDHDTPTSEHADPGPLRAQRLRREHLDSLARCTWRVYGHTYVAQFLYDPEQTWKLVTDGRLHSVVVLDADDEVVGHVGIELETRGDLVGDATLALTDPRYRGHGVLGVGGAELAPIVGELGLVGTLAEAVTPHTITQRAQVEAGAVETAVLLGFIPATMQYRGFPDEVQGRSRQSAVLSYRPITPGRPHRVHLPPAYAELMAERYALLELDRTFADPGSPTTSTQLGVVADRPRSLAALEVRTLGDDAVHVLDHHRRRLCAAGTEVVYAELPLDSPATPQVVDGLRERGFFYAGFIPDLRGSDVLRMQYLDVEVDTSIIQLYTDDARRILQFQLDDRS